MKKILSTPVRVRAGREYLAKFSGRGFTIIELLVTVIVIGILAATGIAKYQNFAETSRRKTCLAHLKEIETAFQTWQNTNTSFSRQAKTAWGFSTRTGRLVGPEVNGALYDLTGDEGPVLDAAPPALVAIPPYQGAPDNFRNNWSGSSSVSGPLNQVIRDDKIWVCPSGLQSFYGGDISNIDDTKDIGLRPNSAVSLGNANVVGLFGRYGMVVVGDSVDIANNAYTNANLPANWVTNGSNQTPMPAPQPPFSLAVCGCYGTFGPTQAGNTNQPGNLAISTNGGAGGGPVGANGSDLTRHSSRW